MHTNREIPKATLIIVQQSEIVRGVDPHLTQETDTQPGTSLDVTKETPQNMWRLSDDKKPRCDARINR